MEAVNMKKRLIFVCGSFLIVVVVVFVIVPYVRNSIRDRKWGEISEKIHQGTRLNIEDINSINKLIVSSQPKDCWAGMQVVFGAYSTGSVDDLTPFYMAFVDRITQIARNKKFKRSYLDQEQYISHIEYYLRKTPTKEAGDLLRMFYHFRYKQFQEENPKRYPIERVIAGAAFLDSVKNGEFSYYHTMEGICAYDPYIVIPAFLPLLKNDIPIIRYCAANIIGCFKDERAGSTLKEIIEDLHPVVAKGYHLKKYGYRLGDDTLTIFRDAIRRTSEIGYIGACLPLVKIAIDTILEYSLRNDALDALRSMKIPVEMISKTEIEQCIYKHHYEIILDGKKYYTDFTLYY